MLSLPLSIDALYAAFRSYPLKKSTGGCACCVSPAEEAALHAMPLRLLSVDVLSHYAASALNTWGGVVELKHFAPRIFELLAGEGFPYPTDEIVFGKLRRAEWRSWPIAEQQAFDDYSKAWWLDRLSRPFYPTFHGPTEAWLCSIAQAHDDLQPFFNLWLSHPGEGAVRHLATFVYRSATKLTSGFWPRWSQWMVDDFISSPRLAERLDAAFFAASSAEVEAELSAALEVCRASV